MGNPRKAFEGVEGCGECWEANWGWETLRYTDRDFFLAPVNKMYAAMAAGAAAAPLPVCCPRSALCEPYVDPMLAHVGPMLA